MIVSKNDFWGHKGQGASILVRVPFLVEFCCSKVYQDNLALCIDHDIAGFYVSMNNVMTVNIEQNIQQTENNIF